MDRTFQWSRFLGVTTISVVVALVCHQYLKSDWWEVAGFITGVVAVYLTAVEHISTWPVGIVNVLLYAWVFYVANLKADMSLQFFFFALSVHGWYSWARGNVGNTELKISRLPTNAYIKVGAGIGLLTTIYVPIITYFKGASPFVDSLLTVVSIFAQVMLNRKVIENWVLWIFADIVYIPLYISRQLYPTAILYGLFLILAIGGLVQWNRNYRELKAA